MRVTCHVPDKLAKEIKRVAQNERLSVSSIVAQAMERYLIEKRRRDLGNKVLEVAGKVKVAPETLDLLEEGRKDDRP